MPSLQTIYYTMVYDLEYDYLLKMQYATSLALLIDDANKTENILNWNQYSIIHY